MSHSQPLLPRAFTPLPLGTIHPAGWLHEQLRVQANGLSGHLDEFWNDIANSAWIGGNAEGWERAPYWLDGLVPLAYLLDDTSLQAKVQHWLGYILDTQHEDGWLGPRHDSTYGYLHDPWPLYIIFKALTQYYEASADSRVIPALLRAMKRIQSQLAEQPLQAWAQMRGPDLLLSVLWLYERTQEAWLLDFAQTVQQQSFDWDGLFATFPFTERQLTWTLESHAVNHAMALKEPALRSLFRQQKEDEQQKIEQRLRTLDSYHGQVTGVFSGDEVLAGRSPSQGTELCAVVEYLFSLEQLVSVFGEAQFADRLERIAYNALPATFKPDMWAHQYDQQANQVVCIRSEDHVYATNGPDANLFGLEPNFGCCTANMHQGWPKFASHLWMRSADQGLGAIAYAPCTLTTQVNDIPVRIQVETNYPFDETIQLTITTEQPITFPLYLYVPGWTDAATLELAHEEGTITLQAGSFSRIERTWNGDTTLRLHFSMPIKTQTRYANSVSLERGPLIYSLKINEEWRKIGGEIPHADWEVHPLSPWNYALQIEREQPEHSCRLVKRPMPEHPFAPENAPLQLQVTGRRLPTWELQQNAAAPVPESPVSSDEPDEPLTLIPYGCTNLRVSEFPTLTDQ